MIKDPAGLAYVLANFANQRGFCYACFNRPFNRLLLISGMYN